MTTALSPATLTRLEKAAVDNGFDQELSREGDWLGFASTQCPLHIWLGTFGDAVFLATFSQQNVARALGEYGTPMAAPLPTGALGGRTVTDLRVPKAPAFVLRSSVVVARPAVKPDGSVEQRLNQSHRRRCRSSSTRRRRALVGSCSGSSGFSPL